MTDRAGTKISLIVEKSELFTMNDVESPTKKITQRFESLTLKDIHDDTVVYNEDANATKADWEKVKMELQANREHIKPKLISLEDTLPLPNETWNEMKHAYGVDSQIIHEDEDYQKVPVANFIIDDLNQSTYSFQDLHDIRLKSTSTFKTAKTTSFQSKFSDTPIEPPRLAKHPQETKQLPLNFKTEIKLIKPEDESMIFDYELDKWIYRDEIKSTGTNDTTTAAYPPSSTCKETKKDVTFISDAEISFSVSKIALVTAITDILKPFTDWDEVTSIDLSNKGLSSMVGIIELLPNLTDMILDNNNLTSFEGLSPKISKLSVKNNNICGHLSNFSSFQNLLVLDASFNKIDSLNAFKGLTNLRELSLSHNKINTLIDLPNVMKLNLSNNKISGDIDFEEYKFPWLWNLNMSHNKITSIKNVSNLKDLLRLEINHNNLNNLELNSPRLKHLELVDNSKEVKLLSLKDLRVLKIDGSVKMEGHCERLQDLSVKHDNELKFFDYDFNKDLQSLEVLSCQLTEAHYKKISDKFPNLHKINLQNNLIKGNFTQLCGFLSKYNNLKYFNLDGNPLLSYLQDEEDRSEYRLMIYKTMDNH